MQNNKDKQKSGKESSMGNPSMDNMSDRDFQSQGQRSGMGGQDKQTGSSGGYGKDTGLQGSIDDDAMTAGGREGQFSDKNRESENQWSPGAGGGPSDD